MYYIDLWLLWKSIGLHVLADDANALYPSTSIRPVLWPGDLVIRPLTLKIDRVLYSAKMHLCMKFYEAMSKEFMGKMWQFHLNMNIEGTLWRHAVTSSVTSWTSETFSCNNVRCSFHILCQKEPISNISKFSKWPPFWGSGALLNRKLYRNLSYTPR